MPLVIVTTRKDLLHPVHYYSLARDLQLIVAGALDAPDDEGGRLHRDEIELRFREIGLN